MPDAVMVTIYMRLAFAVFPKFLRLFPERLSEIMPGAEVVMRPECGKWER